MTLYQVSRCRRCGSDYRAADVDEARAETCPSCGATLGFITAVLVSLVLLGVALLVAGAVVG